jgi:hypothetical protein
VLPFGSSRKDLMRRIWPCTRESHSSISYKRLEALAKLATS